MELGNLIFGNSRGEFPVDRSWEEDFRKFMETIGLDTYGYIPKWASEELKKYQMADTGGFENDTFIVRPYYWGDDENLAVLSNFVYKPTNYQIQWYKYPFRDSYANQDISSKEFKEILQKCLESFRKK